MQTAGGGAAAAAAPLANLKNASCYQRQGTQIFQTAREPARRDPNRQAGRMYIQPVIRKQCLHGCFHANGKLGRTPKTLKPADAAGACNRSRLRQFPQFSQPLKKKAAADPGQQGAVKSQKGSEPGDRRTEARRFSRNQKAGGGDAGRIFFLQALKRQLHQSGKEDAAAADEPNR